jgi:anti-sigma B factor antagonist
MDINLEASNRNGVAVLTVNGELDIVTAPALREELARHIDAGSLRIVVDLRGVDFLDSTALGVMVGAHKRLVAEGQRLAVVCTHESILRVLEITGLAGIFAVHPNLDDALADLAA